MTCISTSDALTCGSPVGRGHPGWVGVWGISPVGAWVRLLRRGNKMAAYKYFDSSTGWSAISQDLDMQPTGALGH